MDLLGKATRWSPTTANTHHVFQDQLLRGGPVSILEAKMKEFCSALQALFTSSQAQPQGHFAVSYQPQIKRTGLEIICPPNMCALLFPPHKLWASRGQEVLSVFPHAQTFAQRWARNVVSAQRYLLNEWTKLKGFLALWLCVVPGCF